MLQPFQSINDAVTTLQTTVLRQETDAPEYACLVCSVFISDTNICYGLVIFGDGQFTLSDPRVTDYYREDLGVNRRIHA